MSGRFHGSVALVTGAGAGIGAAVAARLASEGAAVETTVSALDGLAVLVNNAGIVIHGELPDLEEADCEAQLETNLKGPFLLAIDHGGDGIRVNCVLPGSVRTPMLRQGADEFRADDPEGAIEERGRAYPIGRVLEPAEVAAVICFLASRDASAATGGAYLASGGFAARLAV